MRFETALRAALDEVGVTASPAQIGKMREHFALLETWNARINLTSILDPAEAARRHYGESAFLHRALPETASVVDIGSGAGFPGVPFAALRPATCVTLVESRRKKAMFLREATRGWPNVAVANCRVADWRGTAEWSVIRAVSPASVLPDLRSRVARVAVLGTDRPPRDHFARWEGLPTPWSERRTLWVSAAQATTPGRGTRESKPRSRDRGPGRGPFAGNVPGGRASSGSPRAARRNRARLPRA